MVPAASKAGIINVLPDLDPPFVKNKTALSADWEKGNNNVLDIALGEAFTQRIARDTTLHLVTTYVRNGNNKKASNDHAAMFHARIRYAFNEFMSRYLRAINALNKRTYHLTLWDSIGFETYTQAEWDRFRNLDLRQLVGGGPTFDIAKTNNINMLFGTGYLFEYINGYKPNVEERNHRSSSYVQAEIKMNDIASINNVEFVQVKFNNINDYMLLSDTMLQLKINSWANVETGLRASFDNKPLANVKKLDTTVLVLFTTEFQEQ